MGKKRRIIAKGKKFGTKYAGHPAFRGTAPASTTTVTATADVAPQEPVTTTAAENIDVIAKKVETIEQEVIAAQEEAEAVVEAAPTPVVKAPKPRTRTTKTKRTRKTTKK